MTRKDFELIAATIRSLSLSWYYRATVAEAFADTLATTNPGFDRERFIKACSYVIPEDNDE